MLMNIYRHLQNLNLAIILSTCMFASVYADPFIQDLDVAWKDETPFKSPTDRFLNMHSYNTVYWTLQSQGISLTQKAFYDIVIKQEDRGFMGYNASSHKFRVFQDIIRFTLEEVMGFEFKKDFYFFRYPGDPDVNDHKNADDFLWWYPSVNDNLPEQRNQLISANFSLFNNYDQKYECSAVFFEKAIAFKPPAFETTVQKFFTEMGMGNQTKKIQELFNIGNMVENPKAGVLFQFFDLSYQDPNNKNAYDFLDQFVYPSVKKGVPIFNNKLLSDMMQGTSKSDFLSQYRIVVNNKAFLNPYSSMMMRRYDLNDPKVVKEYENKLRAAIKTISFKKKTAEAYKAKLKALWDLQ